EVRPRAQELHFAPQRRGADATFRRQLEQLLPASRNEHVARIFAAWNTADDEARRELGRHVFHGMNGEVRAAVEQRFFDLFDEQALAANLGQAAILHAISRRDDVELVADEPGRERAKLADESARLGQRERALARGVSE